MFGEKMFNHNVQQNKVVWRCACDGTLCEGICADTHLFRKRTRLNRCPAAFKEKEERVRVNK